MGSIYKKELKSYFSNVTGFIFIAFFLVVLGIFTSVINFLDGGYSGYEVVFFKISFIFLITVPILTMRSFAEERKQKTDQLLYSLPIRTSAIVLGKYFAMLTVFAVPVGISCIYPLILSAYDPSGFISFTSVYSTIFAFFLLGATLISIGMFISSLTENQIIASVLCFGAVFICYIMDSLQSFIPTTSSLTVVVLSILLLVLSFFIYFFTKSSNLAWIIFTVFEALIIIIDIFDSTLFEGLLPTIFGTVSVFGRFNSFYNGIFDVKSIVYFISVSILFNVFTVHSFDKRRWS